MNLSTRWFGFAALLLVTLTVLWYTPALQGSFIWDDEPYVVHNPTLGDLDGLRRIWFEPGATPQYYPLVFTTYWIERQIWGLNPLGYHLVNILLHAGSAILFWRILQRLSVPGAAFAAAVFALHPVHVESVAWIAERKNVLSGLFYLAAALAYLRYRGIGEKRGDEPPAASEPSRPNRLYVLTLGLFLLALLSKTVTCVFPAAMLLLLWWKRGRIERRDILELAPMFLIGLAFGVWTAFVEQRYVGAEGPAWRMSAVEHVLLASRILCFYVGKLFWPDPLTFIYPRFTINAADPFAYLYPAACLVTLGALWAIRRRFGRGPLTAGLLFAGTLFPALGFFNVYFMQFSFVADHFQYHASLSLIALASAVIARQRRLRILPLLQVSVLLLLALTTWSQATTFVSPRVVWEDTLAENSAAWIAHNNLALLLEDEGKTDDAERHYRTALALRPDLPRVESNLGSLLAERGEFVEAFALFEKALAAAPDFFDARFNLATAYARQGDWTRAAEGYLRAIRLRPGDPDAHLGLRTAQRRLGIPGSEAVPDSQLDRDPVRRSD